MHTSWIATAALMLVFGGCAAMHTAPTPEEKRALAPTGKLRAAMLADSPTHAAAEDIGNELARRLGVPFEAVKYKGDKALVDSIKSNQWDIIFSGNSPDRAKYLDFSAPYAQIDTGYLVRSGSPISSMSDVDKAGVRIAVQAQGAADRLITPITKAATIIRVPTIADAIEMLRSGQADIVPANKTNLFPALDRLPGSRILDGRIGFSEQSIGVRKGAGPNIAYVRKFIEEAKSQGFIKRAIEQAGVRGLNAAP
jgi:polar amino acid transport system substrate-binding protein